MQSKLKNSTVIKRGDEIVGTFKFMDKYGDGDNALYFFDHYFKEWEAYDFDCEILTEDEIQTIAGAN